jgi:hypothetical protein
MPRTLDGIVAAHTVASERRKSGRPVWDGKIVANRDESRDFEWNRDEFVKALEVSAWFKRQSEGDELRELWDEIKDAEDVDHFDFCLDAIYDLADEERIWITFNHIEAA